MFSSYNLHFFFSFSFLQELRQLEERFSQNELLLKQIDSQMGTILVRLNLTAIPGYCPPEVVNMLRQQLLFSQVTFYISTTKRYRHRYNACRCSSETHCVRSAIHKFRSLILLSEFLPSFE